MNSIACRTIRQTFVHGLILGCVLSIGSAPGLVFADGASLFVVVSGQGNCSQASPCQLETAMDTAGNGDSIYLAAGTYTGTTDPLFSFDKDLSIYGGWNGDATGEPLLDPANFPVALDGEGKYQVMVITGPATVSMDGFTIKGGNIVSSNKLEKGAGLYAKDTNLSLYNMTFSGNLIDIFEVDESTAYGGGAMIEGGSLRVEHSIFQNNSARAKQSSYGAALAIMDMQQPVAVLDCIFDGNSAWHGGAISYESSSLTPLLTIKRNVFVNNGRGYGSAMSVVGADADIETNDFIDNHASNDSTLLVSYSKLKLSRNYFAGNTCSRISGMRIRRVSAFNIVNNIVVRNSSTFDWVSSPVLQIDYSTGELQHNTIVGNTADYVVRLDDEASVLFSNNIIGSGDNVGVYVETDSAAVLEGTLWGVDEWANGADLGGTGNITEGIGNISGDPDFVDAQHDDYRIGPDSSAIDTAVDVGVNTDFHGQLRPSGAAPDIGADERIVNSCSGGIAIEDAPHEYSGEYYCAVTERIDAGAVGLPPAGEVVVLTGADVVYSAPLIRLFSGFRVNIGGAFRAGMDLHP